MDVAERAVSRSLSLMTLALFLSFDRPERLPGWTRGSSSLLNEEPRERVGVLGGRGVKR